MARGSCGLFVPEKRARRGVQSKLYSTVQLYSVGVMLFIQPTWLTDNDGVEATQQILPDVKENRLGQHQGKTP